MKAVSISGSLRENVGKKDAKMQRSQGLVPCVIYGGQEQYQFVVPEKKFKNLLYTPEVKYVELDLAGKKMNAIVQACQFHPITDKLLHVDFLGVIEGKPITIEIPLRISGTSPGILRGGKLSKRARKIKVKGLLEHVPEYVTIDISNLEIDDSVRVSNLNIDNLSIIEHPNKLLVGIVATRSVEVTEEDTETTEEEDTEEQSV